MRPLAVISSVLLLMSLPAHPVQALKPEIGYRVTPGDYGIIFDQVTVETSESLALRGSCFPAQDTSGIANDVVGGRPSPGGVWPDALRVKYAS
jgi:hypothetical protein